jgi:hypothetical protein
MRAPVVRTRSAVTYDLIADRTRAISRRIHPIRERAFATELHVGAGRGTRLREKRSCSRHPIPRPSEAPAHYTTVPHVNVLCRWTLGHTLRESSTTKNRRMGVDQPMIAAIRAQLQDLAPLTPKQRKTLIKRAQMPQDVLQASVSVIGVRNAAERVIRSADTITAPL